MNDLFEFYRFDLMVALSIYTILWLGQSVVGYAGWLLGRGRDVVLLRRYLLVQLLRARVRRFWKDLLEIAALLAVLAVMAKLHAMIM